MTQMTSFRCNLVCLLVWIQGGWIQGGRGKEHGLEGWRHTFFKAEGLRGDPFQELETYAGTRRQSSKHTEAVVGTSEVFLVTSKAGGQTSQGIYGNNKQSR